MNTPGSGAAAPPIATVADLGERGVIEAIRTRVPAAPAWLLIGIGDDAAVAAPERGALEVFTTDALVEGVHFDFRFSTPNDVGWKAIAVNLSDIAAMGATPRLALLSLALPPALPVTDFHALIDGFLALAREQRVALAGGNITRSPGPLMVDVMLVGAVRPRRVLTRGGGRPGDDLYVTGTIGAALAGLQVLRAAHAPTDDGPTDDAGTLPTDHAEDTEQIPLLIPRNPRDPRAPSDPRAPRDLPDPRVPWAEMAACLTRYRRPEPRCRIGALLGRNRVASACMDLSDGLADAVRQVAEASGTGATIDASALPIDEHARRWFEQQGLDPAAAAVAGGDDYELLFAVPRRGRRRLETVRQQSRGVPLTRIGVLTKEPGVWLDRAGRPEPLPAGFVHF